MTDLAVLLDLLGFEEELEQLAFAPPPPPAGDVADGLVPSAEVALARRALERAEGAVLDAGINGARLARIRAEPHFTVDDALTRALGVEVERWDGDPTVLAVGADEPVVSGVGAVEEACGRLLLDTGLPAAVILRAGDDERVLGGHAGAVYVLALPPLPAPGQVALGSAPEIDVPDVAAIVTDWPAAAWLREATERLRGSPVLLERAAAIGLLARHDMSVEDARAITARMLARDATPRDRALTWARALPPAHARWLAALGVHEAEEMLDDTSVLTDQAGEPHGPRAVRELCRRRELLEAIAELLRVRDDATCTTLDAALETLDDEAATHRTALEGAAMELDDPLLRAVAVQYPTCWWGVA